jgi:hypothetical protein
MIEAIDRNDQSRPRSGLFVAADRIEVHEPHLGA